MLRLSMGKNILFYLADWLDGSQEKRKLYDVERSWCMVNLHCYCS